MSRPESEYRQIRELAVGWIEAWVRRDLEWIREHLAADFVHTSPFGRLEGRDHYLEIVAPLARKSVMNLAIKEVLASDNQAAIWFVNETREGAVPTCDWLLIEEGIIKEVHSFYDTNAVRKILSSGEQERLDDLGS